MALEARSRRAFAISATGHGVLLALVLAYMRSHPVQPFVERQIEPIEFDLALAPLAPSSASHGPDTSSGAIEAALESSSPARETPAPVAAAVPSEMRGAHARMIEPTATNPAIESQPPSGNTNPLPPSTAFVGWDPHNATGSAHATQPLRGTDLINSRDNDASQAAMNGALAGPARGPGATPNGNGANGTDRVMEASAGYLRELVQESTPTNIPGAVPYYRSLARAAAREFHPPSVPIPTVAQTVLNTFVTSTETAQDATRRSLGPLGDNRSGRALELLQYNHPNSPLLQPANTMAARAAATARTTRVEIEVDQDETGRVIATRVIHRSGVSGFDRDAVHAVETAARSADVPAIHGVWRSRWAFEVITSRDPIISALPGVPGEGGSFGVTGEIEFDEVTREVELHLPGMAHVRRRVRVISSRVVERGPQQTAAR